MPAEHLTLNEVAEELDVHYMTVYRYVRLGHLPAHKEGGSWRVLKSDVDALRKEPPAAGRRGHPSTPWNERLLQRLMAADQAGAWSVVEAAQASGMPLRAIYLEMVIPSLRKVGEEWHNGNISVAEEHAASQIVTRIVSRLSAQVGKRGVSKGMVVLGTTAHELHGLPVMLAADLIRIEGFEVLDLGSNLPADAFAEIAERQQRLVAVGVSVTTPGQAETVAETISALRERVDVPIFLGGGAIDGDEHARLLGADGGTPRVEDMVPKLLELVA
ncbi:MAG: helix-turn-helix domain-containing protein [Acidimicrobiia bacterium]|nr:helix-turn-helix domain-containing protein [Acidimicrobiia bacterium]